MPTGPVTQGRSEEILGRWIKARGVRDRVVVAEKGEDREIQREYYYAETRNGDLLWLYYDRVRRRWFLQGSVE